MIQNFLSTFAIILCIAYVSLSILWRRKYDYYVIPIILLLIGIELVGSLARSFDFVLYTNISYSILSVFIPISYAFSLSYARKDGLRGASRNHLTALFISPVLFAVILIGSKLELIDNIVNNEIHLNNWGFISSFIIIVYLLLTLINFERTLSSATHGNRWKIKFIILGMGIILASQFIYYSQLFLRGYINANLMPINSIALITSIPLIAYTRIRRHGGVNIAVSRNAAYSSIIILALGLYFIFFGLISLSYRYFGESQWLPFLLSISMLGGFFLISLLISDTFKRKLKQIISRHFYENKYDYRLQWSDFTERLSDAHDKIALYNQILSAFCDTFGIQKAALFFRLEDNFQHIFSLEMREIKNDFKLSEPAFRILREGKVINVENNDKNLEQDKPFFDHHQIHFVVPILLKGNLAGLIILGPPINANENYTIEDINLMLAMSSQSGFSIENLELADRLSDAREMELVGRISTFIVHDLKNLVYTLSLIIDNANHHIHDPEFQEGMLSSLDNTVSKMKVLISQLRKVPSRENLNKQPARLSDVVNELKPLLPNGDFIVEGEDVTALVDRDSVQKVALNLILNAFDATDGKGPVKAIIGQNTHPFLKVVDQGCGMEDHFISNRLFKPFSTTKEKGIGIGLYQCRHIVEAHGGWIEVKSRPGAGSEFTVWFPTDLNEMERAD